MTNPIADYWRHMLKIADCTYETASDFYRATLNARRSEDCEETFTAGDLKRIVQAADWFISTLTADEWGAFSLAWDNLLTEPNWPPLTVSLVGEYCALLDRVLAQ